MKKEVLITGGAGYIGTTLIPELLVRGYNVTVYDSLSYEGDILIPYFANPNFRFIDEYRRLSKAGSGAHFHISWGPGTEAQSTLNKLDISSCLKVLIE